MHLRIKYLSQITLIVIYVVDKNVSCPFTIHGKISLAIASTVSLGCFSTYWKKFLANVVNNSIKFGIFDHILKQSRSYIIATIHVPNLVQIKHEKVGVT